jgi:hypothetical protein
MSVFSSKHQLISRLGPWGLNPLCEFVSKTVILVAWHEYYNEVKDEEI